VNTKVLFSLLKRPSVKVGVISFFILFFSFHGNIFGVGSSQEWYGTFEKVSSLLVEKRARCQGQDIYKGPITAKNRDNYMAEMETSRCSLEDYKPYASQYGLQVRIITFFAPDNKSSLDSYFHKVEMVLSALAALLLSILVVYVYRIFGSSVAAFSLAGLALSVWVVAFAGNMYWVEWILLLPFVFSFTCYRWFKRRGWLWVFYSTLFSLFVLKLLNGYEYTTTLVVSAFVPIVLHELLLHKRVSIKSLFIKATTVAGVGALALLLSVIINAAALMSEYGSFKNSLQMVMSRVEDRGVGGVLGMQQYVVDGFRATSPEVALYVERFYRLDNIEDGRANPLKYAFLSLFNYMMLPAISLPFILREPIGSIVQSIGMTIILAIVALIALRRTRVKPTVLRALTWSFLVGLGGSFSWLILMPAHMYPHAHINGILFYLPTLIIAYIIFGVYFDILIKKWLGRRK